MYKPATLMVRIHHGFVCQDAINACLLSQRGITGPCEDVLLAPKGYLGFAKWETDPGALTKGIGEEWEMKGTMMKPYTACKGAHTSIDGILDQMEEHHFKVQNIADIDVDESSINWTLVCEPREKKWNPQTVIECQFSLPYLMATAAYDKHIFLDSYTPEAMERQNVRALMTKISAKEDPSLPPYAAKVKVKLKDGRKFSKEYTYSKGHPKNPFTTQDLIDKFKMCIPYSACRLNDAVIDSVIQGLVNLEDVEDVVSALLIPLTPEKAMSD
jgi:2-methylcitrate dehydratase PrpD